MESGKGPWGCPGHGHHKIAYITWSFYFQFWKIDKKRKEPTHSQNTCSVLFTLPAPLRESEGLIGWRFFSWVLCTSLLKTGLKKAKILFYINKTAGLLSRMSMAGKFLHVFITEIYMENLLPVDRGLGLFWSKWARSASLMSRWPLPWESSQSSSLLISRLVTSPSSQGWVRLPQLPRHPALPTYFLSCWPWSPLLDSEYMSSDSL